MTLRFISDYTELTKLARTVSEKDAKAAHERAHAELATAEKAAQTEREKTARLRARRAALNDLLTTKRALGYADAARAYEDAIASDSLDVAEFEARASEALRSTKFLQDALSHYDGEISPWARFEQQKAEVAVIRAKTLCLTAESLLLAVQKSALLEKLIALDGETPVVPAGRTWEAFRESLTWHRRAAEEENRLDAAQAELEKRRSTLKESK